MKHANPALASSFGAVASVYAAHRPDYPLDAVRWALAPAPGSRVVDLGAGTGKLTATLLALGHEVTAVEPDPAMRDICGREVPAARAVPGRAESLPLPDGSIDAVVAGNAMHWFDMDVAQHEIARVLRPGGVLAGLWNLMDDRVGWVAELARAGGHAAIGPWDTPDGWRHRAPAMHLPLDRSGTRFTAPEMAEFANGQRRDAESLIATFSTKAGVLVMPQTERAGLLARMREVLGRSPETSHGEFTLPMVTGVLRVRRG